MTASFNIGSTARLRKHVLALAAWTLAVQANHALATPQDLTAVPFEQLLTMEVYSASKFVQQSSQAPALVTVISASEIRDYGWRTLADVARSVRGLYVSNDRNYSYLGERGFLRPGDFNTRFLLLVDGNRINDGVYDQAPLGGEFPLDLDLVERIEFVPGPGSSIYGSNAFFGVINVITRKGGDLAGRRIMLEAGSAGARKASVRAGWRTGGGTQILLAASSHRTKGDNLYYPEFDTPEQNMGVAEGRDYERGRRLLASIANGPLSVTLTHASRTKGVPTGSYSQHFNDPRSRTTDSQNLLNAAWRAAAGPNAQWSVRLFAGSYVFYGDYPDPEGLSVNQDIAHSRWWGAELSLISTRFAGHTLLAGLDFQDDYRLDQKNLDEPDVVYLDERRHARRIGLFVQDEMTVSAATRLNLGLRYDRNSGLPGVFSPRAALIHALTSDTTLKAIYGTAFRAPNSFERFYFFPGEGGQLPNPGLARETIRSTELALVHRLGENARLTATAFRNVVDGLITQRTFADMPEARFDNTPRVRARGVELEFERRWQRGAALRTSYSYSRAGGAGDGQQVNAPAHLAKLNLAAPLGLGNWRGALELQYVGPRQGLTSETPGFVLANANVVSGRLFHNTDVSIGIYNLFDRRYADPGSTEHLQPSIAQDGRRVLARISHVF